MRRTIPKINAEDVTPTSEANIMLTKGVDATNKAGVVHVMEASVLQTVTVVVVDNEVPTRKWSSLEATSVTTQHHLNLRDRIENNREERHFPL
jgi:hypothetical protein